METMDTPRSAERNQPPDPFVTSSSVFHVTSLVKHDAHTEQDQLLHYKLRSVRLNRAEREAQFSRSTTGVSSFCGLSRPRADHES